MAKGMQLGRDGVVMCQRGKVGGNERSELHQILKEARGAMRCAYCTLRSTYILIMTACQFQLRVIDEFPHHQMGLWLIQLDNLVLQQVSALSKYNQRYLGFQK